MCLFSAGLRPCHFTSKGISGGRRSGHTDGRPRTASRPQATRRPLLLQSHPAPVIAGRENLVAWSPTATPTHALQGTRPAWVTMCTIVCERERETERQRDDCCNAKPTSPTIDHHPTTPHRQSSALPGSLRTLSTWEAQPHLGTLITQKPQGVQRMTCPGACWEQDSEEVRLSTAGLLPSPALGTQCDPRCCQPTPEPRGPPCFHGGRTPGPWVPLLMGFPPAVRRVRKHFLNKIHMPRSSPHWSPQRPALL